MTYTTGPIIWGEPGTNGQHAFYQLIHQGTRLVPSDFIACARGVAHENIDAALHHKILLANCVAQTEALAIGKSEAEAKAELEKSGLDAAQVAQLLPHKVFEGDRPTNTIILPRLSPFTLGWLIGKLKNKKNKL